MQIQQRINAFAELGSFLSQFSSLKKTSDGKLEPFTQNEKVLNNTLFFDEMKEQLYRAHAHNTWFTAENVRFACKSWSEALTTSNLNEWVSRYQISEGIQPKLIAIVMAGNIPLVGFHDFLSILISGNKVLAKLSSKDQNLLPFLVKYLISVEPAFDSFISFTDGKLENFDAVIATGSNNTAKYFDHYFSKYPHIIRQNRNSVAVLTGKETKHEMEALARDVFQYFGLGCRNVSKIYLPKGYNMDHFFNAMYSWKDLVNNDKYMNNYDYNKAVYLMSLVELLDNEFMLLKEDTGFSSPISVVFYEYYDTLEKLEQELSKKEEQIQCIVANKDVKNSIPFGKAQSPELWDYADGEDTIKFLLNL